MPRWIENCAEKPGHHKASAPATRSPLRPSNTDSQIIRVEGFAVVANARAGPRREVHRVAEIAHRAVAKHGVETDRVRGTERALRIDAARIVDVWPRLPQTKAVHFPVAVPTRDAIRGVVVGASTERGVVQSLLA